MWSQAGRAVADLFKLNSRTKFRGGRDVPREVMAQTQSSTGSCDKVLSSRKETPKSVRGAVGIGWFSNTLKRLVPVKGMVGDRGGGTK